MHPKKLFLAFLSIPILRWFSVHAPKGRFYLAFLPVTLLVIVALNQIHLAHTVHLSPWKGGGFGMFSSTDGGPNRHLRIFLRGLPSRHEVQVPQPLEDLADRAKELPSDTYLNELSRRIADYYATEFEAMEGVQIQVWRTEFAPQDLEPEYRMIRDFLFEAERD